MTDSEEKFEIVQVVVSPREGDAFNDVIRKEMGEVWDRLESLIPHIFEETAKSCGYEMDPQQVLCTLGVQQMILFPFTHLCGKSAIKVIEDGGSKEDYQDIVDGMMEPINEKLSKTAVQMWKIAKEMENEEVDKNVH